MSRRGAPGISFRPGPICLPSSLTIEVFRDLGTAFAAVQVLMVGWLRFFLTPLIVMVALPFSRAGILPAMMPSGQDRDDGDDDEEFDEGEATGKWRMTGGG